MAKPTWLTVTPDVGTGNSQLSVKASVHTGRNNRSGSFTAQTTTGSPVVTENCAVLQESPGETIRATVASTNIASTGGTIATLKCVTNAQKLVLGSTGGTASGTVLGVTVAGKDYALNTNFDNDPGVNAEFEVIVRVQIAAHTAIAAKAFAFTLSTPGGKSATFTVNQAGASATLAVSPETLSFVAKGESKTFAISCNPDFAWTISGVPAGWSVSKASGTGPATITVNTPNNTSTAAVTPTLTVSGHDLSKTVKCSQAAGSVVYKLALNTYSTSHTAAGGTSTITGTYTVTWNGVVTSTETNVKPTITGTATGFTISANSVTSANRGKTVGDARSFSGTASYGNATATVSITQAANSITYGTPVITKTTPVALAVAGQTAAANASATFTQSMTYSSGSTDSNTSGGTWTAAVKTAVTGYSLSGLNVTVTNNNSTAARNGFVVTLTVTANGKSASKDITFNQAAGAKVYETPVIGTFSYSNIAPAGGTSNPTISYSQVWTWNGVAGSGGTLTSGATLSYAMTAKSRWTLNTTSGALTATSMGTSYVGSTDASNAVTVTVAINGKSATKTATATQTANSKTLNGLTLTPGAATLAAGGGSTTITSTASYTYASGSTSSAAVSATLSGSATGFTLSTATVTAANRTTVVGAERSITISGSYTEGGVTKTGSCTVKQAANTVSYGAVTISSFTVADIPVTGGTIKSGNVSYSQTATYTSTSTQNITTGATISYSPAAGITASSLGTTVKPRTKIGTLTVTVALNGKSASKDADVYQAAQSAGTVTYSDITVNLTPSATIIAASGGSVKSGTVTYSQVKTTTYATGEKTTETLTSGGTIEYTSTVTAQSKGTTISNQTTAGTLTVKVTMNGKSASKSATIYQAGNYVTALNIAVGSMSYPAIAAGGGTSTPSNGANTVTYHFSSGSTSTTAPASTYGSLSTTTSYSWPGASGLFTALNTSTGAITASSKGTTASDATTSPTVTKTVKATWTPTASYNAAGTKTISGTKTATASQNANAATYGKPTVSMTYGDIPAKGGSVTPTVSFSQSVTWSSGSTQTVTSGGSKSWSGTGVTTSTGAVSGSSLGTTVKARTKITTSTVTVTVNGKSGTKAVDVYQAANAITTYGAVTISGGSVSDIPAGGGEVASMSGISASQTITYTSDSTRAGSVSIAYSTKVSASSLGTTVKARTKIGTLTATATGEGSKTATKALDVYQAANSVSYSAVTVTTATSYATFAAAGATKTPTGTPAYSQTATYTSGSKTTITSGGTISYSMATTTGFTLNSSTTGSLTAANRGTTAGSARTATVNMTVALNGQTGSKAITATQEANSVTSTTKTLIVSSTVTSFGAAGGTATLSTTGRTVTKYTTGQSTTSDAAVTPTYSSNNGAFTISGSTLSAANNWGSDNSRSATITAALSGYTSGTVAVSQSGNGLAIPNMVVGTSFLVR